MKSLSAGRVNDSFTRRIFSESLPVFWQALTEAAAFEVSWAGA